MCGIEPNTQAIRVIGRGFHAYSHRWRRRPAMDITIYFMVSHAQLLQWLNNKRIAIMNNDRGWYLRYFLAMGRRGWNGTTMGYLTICDR